jgi:hypothetical protein
MKKNSLFLVVLFVSTFASALFAQDTMHTLIKPAKLKYLGVYVAPEMQIGQVAGSTFIPYLGNSAMFLLNKRFAFGVTGHFGARENFTPAGYTGLRINNAFGGAKIEYTTRPNSVVHVSFPLIVGGGNLRADSLVYTRFTTTGNDRDRGGRRRGGFEQAYFIVQPGINLEVNVARPIKFFVGASYRIGVANSTPTAPITADAMNGFAINTGLKVGLFDFDLKKERKSPFRKFWKKKSE